MESDKKGVKFINYEKSFSREIIIYCEANHYEYTVEDLGSKDIFHFLVNEYELDRLKEFINFCPRTG